MSAKSLQQHQVGALLQLPLPRDGRDYTTAAYALRLRKPDGSDLSVNAEPVQHADTVVSFKTRKSDLDQLGVYRLYGTVLVSGASTSTWLQWGAFEVTRAWTPALDQSGVA
jgi:hypothetical protein